MNTMYDCIIIGGGMAGLTCAAHLTDSGLHVKVLEKNDRLGGRIRSFYDEDVTIETGASFLAGFYETAHKLVKDCGMDASSQKDSQETWLYRPTKPLGPIWPLSALKASPSLSRAGKLRALRGVVSMLFDAKRLTTPAITRELKRFDNETVVTWGEKAFGKEAYQNVLEPMVRALFFWDCAHTSRGLVPPIIKGVMEDRHFYRLPSGMSSLPSAIGDKVPHVLNTQVDAVRAESHHLYRVDTSQGTFSAKSVVVASPAQDAIRILTGGGLHCSKSLNAIDYSSVTVGIIKTSVSDDLGVGNRTIVISSEYVTPLVAIKVIQTKSKPAYIRFYWRAQGNLEQQHLQRELVNQLTRMNLPSVADAARRGEVVDVVRWDTAIPVFDVGSVTRTTAARFEDGLPPGVFLAGDYMKAPHLEGAAVSGVQAATRVLTHVSDYT